MKHNKKVISILHTTFINDNRVKRIAKTIKDCGYEIVIVAWHKNQLPQREQIEGIPVFRLDPPFNKIKRSNKLIGLLQFLSYSFEAIRRFRKYDIWHCNDFEGLFIGFLAKLSRPKIVLIYDSHELQSGRLGLTPIMKRMIQLFEALAIPLTKVVITVSPGIVRYYEKKFNKPVCLVRNIPGRMAISHHNLFREKYNIKADQKIFLYQGGLVPGRGIDLLIDAFLIRAKSDAVLIIMGDGKLLNSLKEKAQNNNLIFFHPSVSFSDISKYTSSADVGFNMAKNNCLNHKYCLPNKVFEYIQCEIPIITNNLEDCVRLIQQYQIGTVVSDYNKEELNKAIDDFMSLDYRKLKEKVREAKEDLKWENEKQIIEKLYNSLT